MSVFRIVVSAVLAVLAVSAMADYTVPEYPQRPPLVSSIWAELPPTAELGSTIPIKVETDRRQGVTDPITYYLYLAKDGLVYLAATVPAPDSIAGRASFGPYMVNIPDDIPAGDYEYRIGVHQDNARADGRIRLIGKCSTTDPVIVTTGCYTDKYGVPHHWHINHAHTLFWDGVPFMPAGGMFIYDRDWNLVKAQLDLLKQYGVMDIYLHLGVNQPYLWKDYNDDDYAFFQKTIDYLDDNGFTYGIEFQALEAKGRGYNYPAGRVSVGDVKGSGLVRVEDKDPGSAVFLVHDRATGKVVQSGIARVDGNFLEADVVTPDSGDYRVVFSAEGPGPDDYVMYYWGDEYQRYLNKVRSHYSKIKLGPGFRFLVDPLWNEMNTNHNFIPSAPAFAEQFTEWLTNRYGTIEELNKAWNPVGTPWPTFSAAGSTVSVERIDDKQTGKLMQYAYSRTAKRFYTMEACTSQFNYDVREFIGRSLLHYCNDIADEWKKLNDVPVIYKGFSDVDWWHINDTGLASGHDGLGMESYGTGEPLLLFMAAHLFGECEQATKTTWLIVTETGEGNHQDACLSRNKPIGYSDRLGTMYANFNALISGGAKGVYQYNMIGGGGVQDPWTDNISRDPRQLEWLATYARILRNAAPLVDFKPDMYFRFPALFNPCNMELYSEPCSDFYNMGGWWWREPIERTQNNLWVLPTFSLLPNTPMMIVNLENAPASIRFTDELTDAVESGKRISMIGFRKDRGTIPVVDQYYTDRFAVNEHGRRFQMLRPTPSSTVIGTTAAGEVWNLVDGNLQINSEEVFGKHGYQPQNLAFGPETSIDPYYGVFEDLLRVTLLDLGPEIEGFTFEDNGVPITVISTKGPKTTLEVLNTGATSCTYSNGSPAADLGNNNLKIELGPVDTKLVPARLDWAPDGILIDSIDAVDTVIIEGLDGRTARIPSAVEAADAEVEDIASRLPDNSVRAFTAELADCRTQSDTPTSDYISAIEQSTEKFFANATPYIWVEAEDAVSHNYNYSRMGAIPSLSGSAFLGLETSIEPPADTGWYARYEFDCPEDGVYQLWVRENYLSFCSPCSYSIDDGKPTAVSNMLVPHDIQTVTHYNAVEDTRQVFAWYHYGAVRLQAGTRTLTLRVDQPRPKGTVLTMANERPYAKLVDCLVLTQRHFVPDGIERPRYMIDEIEPPMLNLLHNPSMEFGNNDKCDGWTPSQKTGLEWTQPAWGNLRLEGLFDINLHLRDSNAQLRSLRIEPGSEERVWSSDPVGVEGSDIFFVSAWMRAEGPSALIRVRWMGKDGRTLKTDVVPNQGDGKEWQEVKARLQRPAGASRAVYECVLLANAPGPARFDDAVLAAVSGVK